MDYHFHVLFLYYRLPVHPLSALMKGRYGYVKGNYPSRVVVAGEDFYPSSSLGQSFPHRVRLAGELWNVSSIKSTISRTARGHVANDSSFHIVTTNNVQRAEVG